MITTRTYALLVPPSSATSRASVDLLLNEMRQAHVELRLSTAVQSVEKTPEGFSLRLSQGAVQCRSLVVASGGKSIPKMGATGFGYDLAQQFGLKIVETRPALVPLTLEPAVRPDERTWTTSSPSSMVSTTSVPPSRPVSNGWPPDVG